MTGLCVLLSRPVTSVQCLREKRVGHLKSKKGDGEMAELVASEDQSPNQRVKSYRGLLLRGLLPRGLL